MTTNSNLTISDLPEDLHLHIASFCRPNQLALGSANRELYDSLSHTRSIIIPNAIKTIANNIIILDLAWLEAKRARLNAPTLGATVTEALTFINDNGRDLSIKERGQAVWSASIKSQPEIVQALLAHGSISENHRGQAVWSASITGQLEIVQALLAHGSISEDHRGLAMREASLLGHLEIVQALRNHAPRAIHLADFERNLEAEAVETPCPSLTRAAVGVTASIAVGISAWCIQQYIQSRFFG